ncbi:MULTISPECIES: ABC transporter permease [Bordetella]|nr:MULTISPECIES: ABC transporter permease [Bordetella]
MADALLLARPRPAARPRLDGASGMLMPLLLMLLLVHIGPMLWFFFQTFADVEEGFLQQVSALVLSPVMLQVIWNTVWISAAVTLLALLCAYPIAYSLCHVSRGAAALIFICVIVPYFTSVVVRTYSWMVILGRNGLVNQLLMSTGLADAPVGLMYNRTGVLIGMVYVLLPYLVLTLYAAMKSIDTNLLRAASGMGASGLFTFWRVFLPLSMPGVISGCLIVYILAIGFFITPALMGGAQDMMIAMLIQREIETNLNWGLAAVLSLVLLVITMLLYVIYCRYTQIDRMMGKH